MAQHTTATPTPPEYTDIVESIIEGLNAETPALGALNDAIRRGDQGMVRKICSSMETEALPLLAPKRAAITYEYPELLKVLLEKDCRIDESVMEIACERRDRESVRILLAFGWPINKPLGLDLSILAFAVDDLAFTQFLVRLGADVNVRSKLDESALSVAIVRGDMDVIRFLIDNGTDLTHGDLLHCAAMRHNHFEGADLVDELAGKRGIAVCAWQYDNPVAFRWRALQRAPTALHVACENKNILVAEALIRYGADPHQPMLEAGELTGPSPLDLALQSKDRTMIELLKGTWL